MRNYTLLFFLSLSLALPAHAQHHAGDEDTKAIANLVFENDLFAGNDQGYTDGVRLTWLSSEAGTPLWIRQAANTLLPFAQEGKKRISFAVGQSMFTPSNISAPIPNPDDQPYAGWLYASLGVISDTDKTLNTMVLTLGMVGPASYAEQTQKAIHHITHSPQPEGWDYQLKNEPGILFTYQRKWRHMLELSPFGLGIDGTPSIGGNLGNVETSAAIGTTFRLGFDLPADYGPPSIRPNLPGSGFFIPTQTLGGYIFTAVEAHAVARNIFLDGNTFADSEHVDKKPFLANLQLGATLTYKDMRISYTQLFMTREFKTQEEAPQFGALTVSYRF